MAGINRRNMLFGSLAAGGMLAAAARWARAQNKPEKLVYIGENQGGWKRTLVEEVGPAYEKATGIKVEFTLLAVDAWRARLKAELGAESSGIDIAQWSVGMAGWMAPHLLDHEPYLATIAKRDPDFDWGDFLSGSKHAASYDERLIGIPYRITTGILHYQKPLFDQAGITQPPTTFAEFEKAALAVNTPPDRYAFGLMGRQGSGSYSSFASWLFSAGGKLVDFKTGEVFINDAHAVTALEFYVDLVLKHKVVPPEAMTWEFDEIIAGGQNGADPDLDYTPEERTALAPVVQPLVLTHPRTGRKSVYVASHTSHILDMEVADGRLLLMELIELATRAGTTYRHEWQVGDLVMWDNRRSLHRGLPFDERFPRDLRRVTTSDGTEPARDAPRL